MIRSFIRRLASPSRRRFAIVDPPDGTFEIRGQRCLGYAIEYSRHPQPLTVTLWRAGKTLASIEVPALHKHGRRDFSIDFGDDISPIEFLNEIVEVRAENLDGQLGRLRMDGSAQIDLIRQHMGKPKNVLRDIDCSAGGNSAHFLVHGWADPERLFCWSNGRSSEVLLGRTSLDDAQYELTFLCQPCILPPKVTIQEAKVFINDTFINNFDMVLPSPRSISLKVPGSAVLQAEDNRLRLEYPNAIRPSDISNVSDGRLLAFAFRKITFSQLLLQEIR